MDLSQLIRGIVKVLDRMIGRLVSCENDGRKSATLVWKMYGCGSDKSVQLLPGTHGIHREKIIADLKNAVAARNGIIVTDEYATCVTTFEF